MAMIAEKGGFFLERYLAFPLLLFIFLFFLSFSAVPCTAKDEIRPVITDVLLTTCQDSLCINFRLRNGLTRAMEQILQGGIPVVYVYKISLEHKRMLWDDKLKDIEIRRTIALDNIRDEYILNFSYPLTRIITASHMNEAADYLLTVKQLPVIKLKKLVKGRKYTILIRAFVKKEDTSMPFKRLIKIFSSFDFSTDPYEIEFQY